MKYNLIEQNILARLEFDHSRLIVTIGAIFLFRVGTKAVAHMVCKKDIREIKVSIR